MRCSTVARAVVAAGLHPTIGIFHANRGNAFALADDLVEPFRPLVDALVLSLLGQGVDALDPTIKRRFAQLIAFDVRIGDEVSPVSVAAGRLAQSLARSFETTTSDLALFVPPTRAGWATLTRPLDPIVEA
jgi:CRISP-associated protein Cas1